MPNCYTCIRHRIFYNHRNFRQNDTTFRYSSTVPLELIFGNQFLDYSFSWHYHYHAAPSQNIPSQPCVSLCVSYYYTPSVQPHYHVSALYALYTTSELNVRCYSMNQHFWAQNIKIYYKNNKKCHFAK